MQLPPPEILIPMVIVAFFAIGLHEYAHCKAADLAGDPTPGIHGRVTLDLTKHFELMGTIMMFVTFTTGYGIGWGKPAPMDPRKMRNPRWDLFIAVAAGPITNLLQAGIYAVFMRFALMSGSYGGNIVSYLLFFGVLFNLSLAFFNLIPLGPLDGHWLVGQLLPEKQRYYWYRFNRQYGGYLLLAIIVIGQIANYSIVGRIVGPAVNACFMFLTGKDVWDLRPTW